MRVWIISCLVLFGMVEIYHWIKHFTLPFPMLILGGALLAIASNYGKHAGWSFQEPTQSDDNSVKTPTASGLTNIFNWPNLNQSSATPVLKPSRSISFTIRRAQEEVRNDKKG